MAAISTGHRIVVGIDFGTTFSGYTYSVKLIDQKSIWLISILQSSIRIQRES